MNFNPDTLPADLRPRWDALLAVLRRYESAMVAFSGGVDSGLLSAAAFAALGSRMLAVTFDSPVNMPGELRTAQELARQAGFPHSVVEVDDLLDPGFAANPPDRCYLCKLRRLKLAVELAKAEGYAAVLEGSNADDAKDYRPGMRAVRELGVRSPLEEAGLTKAEIRGLAQHFGLLIWDHPSAPCLATRFPYGSQVTREGLVQVQRGETFLAGLGLRSVRVRHQGAEARLEVAPDQMDLAFAQRETIRAFFKELGFKYVALDLEGYRMGSLNEVLKP